MSLTLTRLAALGLYPNRRTLEQGVERLHAAGFGRDHISVVLPQSTGTLEERQVVADNAAGAAKIGGGTGALVGGTLGLLIAGGVLAIPGIGAFLLLGPLAAGLFGTAIGGGLGTLIGSYVGLNASADEVRVYEERLKKGEALLRVDCDDDAHMKLAEGILASTGADKVYHKP